MLLSRAEPVVKGNYPLGEAAQVGDDKADTRIQFTGVSFDFCHNPSFLVRRPGLIAEAGMETANMVWPPADVPRGFYLNIQV